MDYGKIEFEACMLSKMLQHKLSEFIYLIPAKVFFVTISVLSFMFLLLRIWLTCHFLFVFLFNPLKSASKPSFL